MSVDGEREREVGWFFLVLTVPKVETEPLSMSGMNVLDGCKGSGLSSIVFNMVRSTYSMFSPFSRISSSSLSNFVKGRPVASSHVHSLMSSCVSAGRDTRIGLPYAR